MDSIQRDTRSAEGEDTRKDMRHVQCTLGTCVKLYSKEDARCIENNPIGKSLCGWSLYKSFRLFRHMPAAAAMHLNY